MPTGRLTRRGHRGNPRSPGASAAASPRHRGKNREALRRGRDRERDQLARRRGAAGEEGLEGLCARAEPVARRGDSHRGDHRARVPPRGLLLVASAVRGLGRLRRAEGRSRRARPGVPEHRARDRDPLPGRAERLPDHLARGERQGARPGLGAHGRRVPAERRHRLRPARHGALVAGRREAGLEGAEALRAARPGRVRREDVDELPRLDGGDVRGRARPRPLRAVGAPHRARAGRGVVRVHGPGDRRRDRARRDAGAAWGRREAGRGAARDRRGRRRAPARRGGRSSACWSSSTGRRVCGRRTAR